jgi:hypothetical protein
METRQFDKLASNLAQPRSRRGVLGLFGAAIAAGGLGFLGVSESEARRGRGRKGKNKKNKGKDKDNNNQPQQPELPFADIAIESITIEALPLAAHDNVVVQFTNIGSLTSGLFRIGLVAVREDGNVRDEVFSLPFSLAPNATGTEKFQLGCGWINNGTVTVRTDPSPVPNEPATRTANNQRSASFGATICS